MLTLVGEEDAAGHEDEDVAEVGARWVGDEAVGREAGRLQDGRVEVALVFEVVDGEDAGGIGELGHVAVGSAQPVGDEAGVPVVAVDDVGAPVQHAGGFEGGAGEEGEAMTVVRVAVDGGSGADVVLVVDEQDFEAIELDGVEAHALMASVEGEVEAGDAGTSRDGGEVDRAVAGDGDADVETAAGEGPWEGGHYVCEAAGLGKGVELGGDHEDAERRGLGRFGHGGGLVAEVAFVDQDEDAAAGVDGVDDFLVAEGAGDGDDGTDAGVEGGLGAVGEGEEGVGGEVGAAGGVAGLFGGVPDGVDAVDLAAAQADEAFVPDQHDGVGFDVADDLEAETKLVEVVRRWLGLADHAHCEIGRRGAVGSLDEVAAVDAPDVGGLEMKGRAGDGRGPAHDAEVLAAAEASKGGGFVVGGDDDVVEVAAHGGDGLGGDRCG